MSYQKTTAAALKLWHEFQTPEATPANAERQARGLFFATCPNCRIIFSMQDSGAQKAMERWGCSICRQPGLKKSEVAE
jgi:hypothetical protein